ncbi:Sin-like protein conserved region-domain-containing protein [Chaetomidium leptoderma]|uniref:Sin-like protein conserved region-domain-containing protein n=1 Tax=Chaetomidium leptoderma TaxID=669021 RepID=A0AAN6VMY0_9PEZI|nr:Sin-like protein conserved region-domain-containing protein [Chaetomidium leptoderma]
MSAAHAPRGAQTIPDDDNDPIVASYSVFIKPPLADHRNLVALQYVNKTAQDPAQIRVPRIAELRMKPGTGMYEVDVPIDTAEAYDRNKGVAWGSALQKSMEAKKGGSLGLAGGFNIVATSTTARGRRGAGATTDDEPPLHWAEAARQDKVLRTQTFGGGRSAEEENTRHMIGVFQGKNLHLTPVSSVVHLRPVPHHLDAATEQDRLSRGPTTGASSGGGGPPEKAGAAGAAGAAGRAIHMTIKSAMDADGGVATETMADRLRNVQTETWQRMEWVHDEAEMAWEAYNECLLLRSGAATTATGDDGPGGEGTDKDKGKGKEAATTTTEGGGDDESGAADLVEKVSQLKTDWGEQELLQAVSGGAEGQRQPGRAGRGAAAANSATTPAAAAAGGSAPRKGTRARTKNTRANAMEID